MTARARRSSVRPVDRPEQARARTLGAAYQLFGQELVRAFGAYCIACEAPLATGLQVDHRIALKLKPEDEEEGEEGEGSRKGKKKANFNPVARKYGIYDIQYEIACGPCNRIKSNQITALK